MNQPDFSLLEADDVIRHLNADSGGLTELQASQIRDRIGWNELPETGRQSLWLLFLSQFKSVLVLVLILAALLSWFTSHQIDAYVILVVVFLQAGIGFFQSMRAGKAIDALKRMVTPLAKVYRDGIRRLIPSRELVPGDIIELEEGDSVPADARLIEAINLRTIESSLTGESIPVGKQLQALANTLPFADQTNMIWNGTFVAGGFGRAVVTSTGSSTQLGTIAATLREIKTERSNFRKKIDKLATQMGMTSIAAATLLFILGIVLTEMPLNELLLVSVAAMVAIIPEGLPAIIAIVLAIGALRMSRRNAIIREITATETLGSVSTIITDKTGTLTENALTVRQIYIPEESAIEVSGEGWFPAGNFVQHGRVMDQLDHPALNQLFKVAALANNASIEHKPDNNTYVLAGDPTEGALLVLSRKGKSNFNLTFKQEKLFDLPFDSNAKFRATLIKESGSNEVLVMGAPEKIIEQSHHYITHDGVAPLNERQRDKTLQVLEAWSGNALRVIGLAYKNFHHSSLKANDVNDLVFIGMVGIIDPPRAGVLEAVRKCRQAGIRVIMATGDHINTAISIARQVGIIDPKREYGILALSDDQLKVLDEKEFDEAIQSVNVFARLSPATKLRIARHLQAMGQLVAMTGDGVNDAPALRQSDVGIAMGIMGTDVARDAAQVVLADDNFSTIVNAIEEGRIVFNNARIATYYLITTNMAEIFTLIATVSLGLPIPLTAIQILWLNLVTDSLGNLAIATERGHGDLLREKPVQKGEKILNKSILPFILINVLVMGALSLTIYFQFLPQGIEKSRSGVFVIMSFTQLFNMYNMRSVKSSVFEIGVFGNRYVNYSFLFSSLLTFVVIEMPIFNEIFNFQILTLQEFTLLAFASSMVLVIGEAFKWTQRKLLLPIYN